MLSVQFLDRSVGLLQVDICFHAVVERAYIVHLRLDERRRSVEQVGERGYAFVVVALRDLEDILGEILVAFLGEDCIAVLFELHTGVAVTHRER